MATKKKAKPEAQGEERMIVRNLYLRYTEESGKFRIDHCWSTNPAVTLRSRQKDQADLAEDGKPWDIVSDATEAEYRGYRRWRGYAYPA